MISNRVPKEWPCAFGADVRYDRFAHCPGMFHWYGFLVFCFGCGRRFLGPCVYYQCHYNGSGHGQAQTLWLALRHGDLLPDWDLFD